MPAVANDIRGDVGCCSRLHVFHSSTLTHNVHQVHPLSHLCRSCIGAVRTQGHHTSPQRRHVQMLRRPRRPVCEWHACSNVSLYSPMVLTKVTTATALVPRTGCSTVAMARCRSPAPIIVLTPVPVCHFEEDALTLKLRVTA